MNYQFRNAIQSYMINGDIKAFNNALEIIRENYPKETWEAMLNLVDSHNTIRNITKLDNPTWEEENNKIAPEASDMALKLQALTAIFQMGYPGAPTVYYGDEVGVTGAKDPDSRRTFPWERVLEKDGSANVSSYVSKLQPKTVYVVGGEVVISTNIETQIKKLNANIKIVRLGGANSYETSIKITGHFNLVTTMFVSVLFLLPPYTKFIV